MFTEPLPILLTPTSSQVPLGTQVLIKPHNDTQRGQSSSSHRRSTVTHTLLTTVGQDGLSDYSITARGTAAGAGSLRSWGGGGGRIRSWFGAQCSWGEGVLHIASLA